MKVFQQLERNCAAVLCLCVRELGTPRQKAVTEGGGHDEAHPTGCWRWESGEEGGEPQRR